ncbi:MAG: HAD-IB family hydrolase [Alphaproteobacteria bacterium]
MSKHRKYMEHVANSPDGPQIGAFFDFDGTIIAGYSATAMLREKFMRREISPGEMIGTVSAMGQFGTGRMGFSGLMLGSAKLMKGISEDSHIEFGEELYEKHIARKVYPETRSLIELHLKKGHTVAIISSATPYQVTPTARDLGIEHVLCSNYEVEDGVFTGNIIRPLCFGEGKVIAAETLAEQEGTDLDQSYFYSDSDDDIELLERVGHPRPLNPNRKLTKIAKSKGWPTLSFNSRGRPTALDFTRTVYATGSLATSFAAGLPIWALTRSKDEGRNFSMGLFGDLAAAIAGVKLDVTGKQNLWAQRPAVIIFNHQSKADVMIMAKLIRRDMAGIGKQEIKNSPIIGRIMEYAGTVFIDRKNSSSAIEAMAPLVDVIKNEGKSVAIAPEGTRSLSPKLLPFKKGAFHLALQAGVPILPIVIHNAGDIAPKNEFVMRPGTVKIDVLPPVDTSEWTVKNMNAQVASVRQMFLDTLGQSDNDVEQALGKAKAKAKTKTRKPSSKKGTQSE